MLPPFASCRSCGHTADSCADICLFSTSRKDSIFPCIVRRNPFCSIYLIHIPYLHTFDGFTLRCIFDAPSAAARPECVLPTKSPLYAIDGGVRHCAPRTENAHLYTRFQVRSCSETECDLSLTRDRHAPHTRDTDKREITSRI